MTLYHQLQNFFHNGLPLGTIIINHLINKFSLHKLINGLGDDIIQTVLTQWLSQPSIQIECRYDLQRVGLDVAEDAIEQVLSEKERHQRIVEDMIIEVRLTQGDSRHPLHYSRRFNRLRYRRRF